jgi:hypothetical protein
VRLTEAGQTYTAPLRVISDPRMKHTMAERQAQWELANKLYGMLNNMSGVVGRMNTVRGGLDDRASNLPPADTLTRMLKTGSDTVDTMRKKIVATKEGGMITGEERLRENLTELYGSVVGFEGPPSAEQQKRTTAINRELGDVSRQFDAWVATGLSKINSALEARGLKRIELLVP